MHNSSGGPARRSCPKDARSPFFMAILRKRTRISSSRCPPSRPFRSIGTRLRSAWFSWQVSFMSPMTARKQPFSSPELTPTAPQSTAPGLLRKHRRLHPLHCLCIAAGRSARREREITHRGLTGPCPAFVWYLVPVVAYLTSSPSICRKSSGVKVPLACRRRRPPSSTL
jgi:hypothetical protein